MKIVVLKSCPNKHGSSNLLSDEVIKGAEESGLSVAEIDVARVNVTPCIGCVGNGNHSQFSRDGLWHSRLVYTRTGIVDRKLKIDIKKRTSGGAKPLKALVYCGFPSYQRQLIEFYARL